MSGEHDLWMYYLGKGGYMFIIVHRYYCFTGEKTTGISETVVFSPY